MITNTNFIFTPYALQMNSIYDAFNPDKNFTIYSSGTALSQINDLGLNGNTQSQATGASQPTYIPNVINGNPVFRFNGTSQWTSAAAGAGNNANGAITVCGVWKTNNNAVTQRIICKLLSWSQAMNSTSSFTCTIWIGATGNSLNSATVVSASTFYSNIDVYNNSTADIYIDGAKDGVSGGSLGANSATTNALYLGSRDGTQQWWNGDCAFMAFRYSAFQNWEVNLMNYYLNKRFNLA